MLMMDLLTKQCHKEIFMCWKHFLYKQAIYSCEQKSDVISSRLGNFSEVLLMMFCHHSMLSCAVCFHVESSKATPLYMIHIVGGQAENPKGKRAVEFSSLPFFFLVIAYGGWVFAELVRSSVPVHSQYFVYGLVNILETKLYIFIILRLLTFCLHLQLLNLWNRLMICG